MKVVQLELVFASFADFCRGCHASGMRTAKWRRQGERQRETQAETETKTKRKRRQKQVSLANCQFRELLLFLVFIF